MTIRLAALLFAALVVAAPSEPQAPAQPGETIRATRDEVVLDVIVRDKKGRSVRDLTAADIQVYDNGVLRPVGSIRLVEGRDAAAGHPITGSSTAPRQADVMRQVRLVTLVFERLTDDSRGLARDAARELIANGAPNTYFAVLALDQSIRPLEQFTNDRPRLLAAVDRATSAARSDVVAANVAQKMRDQIAAMVGPAQGGETLSERIAEALAKAEASQTITSAADAAAAAASARAALDLRFAGLMLNMMQYSERMAAQQAGHASFDGLMALIAAQRELSGRKTVLYFSEGLSVPPSLVPRFQNLVAQANRANISFYAIDARGLFSNRLSAQANDTLRGAVRASRTTVTRTRGAVTVEEVRALDTAEESMHMNTQQALSDLAEQTGGFLIANTNDFRGPVRRVAEEINTYYEIAYNPAIERYDGTFRKTEVRVNRPNVKVQARAGYFALPPSSRGTVLAPFEIPLLDALSRTPSIRELDFRSAAVQLEPARQGAGRALLVIEVPFKDVRFSLENGRYKAHLAVLGVLRDPSGNIVEKISRDLPLDGEAERVDELKTANFVFRETFAIRPGRYTLETAVQDPEAGKTAVRKAVFVVPRRDASVAMAGLISVRNYEPSAQALGPSDPLFYEGGRITPQLEARVSRKAAAQLGLYVNVFPDPANTAPATLGLEYMRDGAIIAADEIKLPAPDPSGRVARLVNVPASNLPSGTYDIRAVARQGSATAEERISVVVE